MPSVTIEQNLESRQTYLRLRNVGRILNKPQYSIAGDSNQMLGPEGWKNQVIINEARQYLDGADLLLEIDPRLINYIEPGRAIEVQVGELKFAERIPSPPLMAFPSSRAPLPGDLLIEPFGAFGGAPLQPPRRPRDDDATRPSHGSNESRDEGFKLDPDQFNRSVTGTDEKDRDHDTSHRDDDDQDRTVEMGRSDDEDRHEAVDVRERSNETGDDETRIAPDDDDRDDAQADPEVTIAPKQDGEDDTDSGEDEPEPRPRRNWAALIGAILVGLVLGFSAKYVIDEYSPWSNQTAIGPVKRKIELVQTDAFGPLAEDLKRLPDKSPLGLGPDELPGMTPLTINRGLFFFNYGAPKLSVNRAEATYWFKRSVKMIEPDALAYLGDGYLNGDGVPRDARTGYQLIRLGAALGSEKARSYLVERLEAGLIANAPTTMGQAFRPR